MTREQATRFFYLLVAILVATSSAGQQGSASPVTADKKQQVLDLEQEWVTAEVRHDAIAAAFTVNADHHALTVDVTNLETAKFGSSHGG